MPLKRIVVQGITDEVNPRLATPLAPGQFVPEWIATSLLERPGDPMGIRRTDKHDPIGLRLESICPSENFAKPASGAMKRVLPQQGFRQVQTGPAQTNLQSRLQPVLPNRLESLDHRPDFLANAPAPRGPRSYPRSFLEHQRYQLVSPELHRSRFASKTERALNCRLPSRFFLNRGDVKKAA